MAAKKRNQKKEPVLKTKAINLRVNGKVHALEVGSRPGDIEPFHTLSHTLRETLGLTGTKISCDNGACGACTVLIDGKAMLSCMTLTVECDGKKRHHYRRTGRPQDRNG